MPTGKITVKFLENRTVKDERGNVVEKFEAGKEYAMNSFSAARWIRRHVAEEVVAKDAEPDPRASAGIPGTAVYPAGADDEELMKTEETGGEAQQQPQPSEGEQQQPREGEQPQQPETEGEQPEGEGTADEGGEEDQPRRRGRPRRAGD